MRWKLTHLRLLVVVGFEAADEEGLAGGQSLHEGVQRHSELTAQRRHLLAFVVLQLRRQQKENAAYDASIRGNKITWGR